MKIIEVSHALQCNKFNSYVAAGDWVMRLCWVNFQCRGVLLFWIRVRQGPTALLLGTGGGVLDIFSLVYHFSFLSPCLWETARCRLKYGLKGSLSPKQPINQSYVARNNQTITSESNVKENNILCKCITAVFVIHVHNFAA